MRMRRRVRSWRQHTTSQEMARAFVGVGAALVLVCAILLGVGTHWL